MSALLAALAFAQDEPPREALSAAYRPTVEGVTKPLRHLECRLADRDRRWSRLSLGISGGRGYREANGQVRATRREVRVEADPAGLLEGLPLWRAGEDALLFGSERGRSVVLRPVSPPPVFSTVVLVPRGPGMTRSAGDPAYAGFCEVTETPQRPLDPEETVRETRQ